MNNVAPELPADLARYRDARFIASGGQKHVFSATCEKNGPVVVKLFKADTDMARFKRELSAVTELQCPLTPSILEWGLIDYQGQSAPYVVEPFIPGASIQQHLDAGSLQDDNILQIAKDVLSVLTLTEQKGIVHRDIKPANLLLHSDTSEVWLLDFGIVRHMDRTALTVGPMGPCTPGYAPPEQFNAVAAEIDVRSDIFALGVTLHTCVVGQNPFWAGAADGMEVFQRMQTMQLPRLSREPAGLTGFADLVAAMTQPRRTNRPRTAVEAKDWLDDLLAQRSK
ncbi:serine/threonine protein kinase [Cupriavidus sp. SS-3]|uniref:serine/threonine protein kinase n=1 Tax=Cupriavidus sp. SS-3 TaxID=3109596 RepID=UPI002DB7EF97|nr:serine/threonine-protein kinase [Cupriavidus sp. SS-3]MEC3766891.1 serine/threonine-protein kinase [Cupriavidus sp. SS-3]